MSLAREATIKYPGFQAGDIKIAHYAITYTAGAITSPANDPLWFLLNGASLSTTTYPLLFAKFGYSYGGSGANFNLPDLTEGKLPIARGLTSFPTLGATGGEINHTLSSAELYSHVHGNTLSFAAGSHGHSASGSVDAQEAHAHTALNAENQTPGGTSSIGTSPYTQALAVVLNNGVGTGSAGSHSHSGSLTVDPNTSSITKGGSISATGSGGAHNNMQPYIVVGGWLVKFG